MECQPWLVEKTRLVFQRGAVAFAVFSESQAEVQTTEKWKETSVSPRRPVTSLSPDMAPCGSLFLLGVQEGAGLGLNWGGVPPLTLVRLLDRP